LPVFGGAGYEMKSLVLLAFCALFTFAAGAAEPATGFDDPVLNERYWGLIREIRCPKCLNESIADSDAPVAADLRREVHRLIADGKSDTEVKDFLAARYGEFVLYRPRVAPVTYALWAGPFVFLLAGSVVFWRVLRVRRNQPLDDEDPIA
jgi:cytochrome c-type biogenesis protein CcmH